jgi:3-hydroxybutyryl-CoA dehydrogenase
MLSTERAQAGAERARAGAERALGGAERARVGAERALGGAGHRFERAAVVGAGLMGRGIAQVLAVGGLDVVLYDAEAHILDDSVEAVRARLGEADGHGLVTGAADLDSAVGDADLVVEAVTEDLGVKREVFARISAATPSAVLATNTSVLPVTAIAEQARHPERVLGTHWWNPPDLIPVVEVVPGRRTSAEVTERVVALLGCLGKTPVRVRRDVPGFIGNRLQHALWREAIALVADGICDAETVDLVARNTIGLRLARLGPLENADYVGLDLTLAIHDTVIPALSRDSEPSHLLRELVARGDLGAKTGRGFLEWRPGDREAAARALAAHLTAQTASGPARCSAQQSSGQQSSGQQRGTPA